MEEIQPTQSSQQPEHLAAVPHNFSKFIVSMLVVSFLAGAGGGFLGLWYGQKRGLFNQTNGTGGTVNQKVVLAEDSAIIDVVKKASPAVVSIVISKDLSKIPGYGADPNSLDPFSPFFGFNSRSQQNRQSVPNIQQVGAGSGFFVTKDGLILTNKHVVSDESASYSVLTNDGKKYDAQVLARDPVNDLALVKVSISDAPTLQLGDSGSLQIGQRVIAIGNSLGQYQNTVTTGVVSGIGRSITAGGEATGSEQLEGVIQTDAAINPGNSGGPLLNTLGQVVGINTAIDQQGQLVGFSIPANDAQKAVDSFQKNGKITRPYLGVRYLMVTKALADEQKLGRDYGALVIHGQNLQDFAVLPGSPADKAGIVENDIILACDGKKLGDTVSLSSCIKQKSVGDTLQLTVFHRGQEKQVTVRLEESK